MPFPEGELHISDKVLCVGDFDQESKSQIESHCGSEVAIIKDAKSVPTILEGAAAVGSFPAFIISRLRLTETKSGLDLAEQIRGLGYPKARSISVYLLSEGEVSEEDKKRAGRLNIEILDIKDLFPDQANS